MKRKASKARTVEQIIRILRQADGGQHGGRNLPRA